MARESNTIQRKDIYAQLCDEFRSLNAIFWRVPILAMSLNGGVGFALGSIKLTSPMQIALLVFIFLCNVSFIFILCRLRMRVMQDVLDRIAEFEHRPLRPARFHVVYAFMAILGTAAIFSVFAIPYRDVFFQRADNTLSVNVTVQPPSSVRISPTIDE